MIISLHNFLLDMEILEDSKVIQSAKKSEILTQMRLSPKCWHLWYNFPSGLHQFSQN